MFASDDTRGHAKVVSKIAEISNTSWSDPKKEATWNKDNDDMLYQQCYTECFNSCGKYNNESCGIMAFTFKPPNPLIVPG